MSTLIYVTINHDKGSSDKIIDVTSNTLKGIKIDVQSYVDSVKSHLGEIYNISYYIPQIIIPD